MQLGTITCSLCLCVHALKWIVSFYFHTFILTDSPLYCSQLIEKQLMNWWMYFEWLPLNQQIDITLPKWRKTEVKMQTIRVLIYKNKEKKRSRPNWIFILIIRVASVHSTGNVSRAKEICIYSLSLLSFVSHTVSISDEKSLKYMQCMSCIHTK